MTHDEALTRLKQCRALQSSEMQVIVAADIVDALLVCPDCLDSGYLAWHDVPGVVVDCECRS